MTKLRGVGKTPISIQTLGGLYLLSHIYFFVDIAVIPAAAIAHTAKRNSFDLAAISGFCFLRKAYQRLVKT